MSDKILSFLISTYNNKDVILSNVNNILKIKSDKIEVVVADDFSSDDTILELKKIDDNRLVIVESSTTKGHGVNIINAISSARAKYVFFLKEEHNVMSEKIQMLLDFLQKDEYDLINSQVDFLKTDKLAQIVEKDTFFLEKVAEVLTSFDISGSIIRREVIDIDFFKTVDEEMLFGFPNIYINSTLLNGKICLLENSFVKKPEYVSVKNFNEATMFINIVSIWLLYSNITDGEKKIIAYQLFVKFTDVISYFVVENKDEYKRIKDIFIDEFLKLSRETDTYEICQEVLINTSIEFIEKIGEL